MSTLQALIQLSPKHEHFLHDVRQQFEETTLIVKPVKGGESFPFYVTQYRDTKILGYKCNSNGTIDEHSYLPEELDYEVFMPEPGIYAITNGVLVVTQRAARQYKKSFSNSTHRIWASRALSNLEAQIVMYYQEPFVNLENIDVKKAKLTTSYALSRDFWLMAGTNAWPSRELNPMVRILKYRDTVIGFANLETKVIDCHDIMYQELLDLLNRTGVKTWTLQVITKK